MSNICTLQAANASAAELATLERQNDHLRRDVERFEQRETIINEVSSLRYIPPCYRRDLLGHTNVQNLEYTNGSYFC